jgi:hypothetical protein
MSGGRPAAAMRTQAPAVGGLLVAGACAAAEAANTV